jgi:nitrogen fixation protein FixH
LRHPADAERDRALVFARHGNLFLGQVSKVTPGAWDVLVHAKSSIPFEASRRLWLR